MKIISIKIKRKILELYTKDKDMSKTVIAQKCGVSRSYVHKIIKENS